MWVLIELKWFTISPLAVLVNMARHSWVVGKVGNFLMNFVSINFSRILFLGIRSTWSIIFVVSVCLYVTITSIDERILTKFDLCSP